MTDCSGRPPDEPVARLNALAIPGLEVSSVPPTAEERARARAIEAGGRYAVVWKSGALRHEPAAKGSAAPAASPAGAAASAGPATSQPVPARARYVQIGAFADPVNAERAIGRMRTLGLPVAIADQTRNGRAIRTIFVGPYEAASDVALALQVARRGGYADAFAR